MSTFKPGDVVSFTPAVLRRAGDDLSRAARGTVIAARDHYVSVDFAGTWIAHESGGTIRHIPPGNLRLIKGGQ